VLAKQRMKPGRDGYKCRNGRWMGGQRIMVFPDLDSVVIFTGGNYLQQHRLDEVVSSYILPALGSSR